MAANIYHLLQVQLRNLSGLAGGLSRDCSQDITKLQAMEGLTGAGRPASKMAYSHGWQVRAAWRREASVLHMGVSSQHATSFPHSKQSKRAKWKPQHLWWPSLGSHASFPHYHIGYVGRPYSLREGSGQGHEGQEARITGDQFCRLATTGPGLLNEERNQMWTILAF